jgi:hypothetical protein
MKIERLGFEFVNFYVFSLPLQEIKVGETVEYMGKQSKEYFVVKYKNMVGLVNKQFIKKEI